MQTIPLDSFLEYVTSHEDIKLIDSPNLPSGIIDSLVNLIGNCWQIEITETRSKKKEHDNYGLKIAVLKNNVGDKVCYIHHSIEYPNHLDFDNRTDVYCFLKI